MKALKIIEDLEKHMEHLKNINYSDKLFNNISDALNHILLTCKSNTMIYNNDIENLDEVRIVTIIKLLKDLILDTYFIIYLNYRLFRVSF